MKRPSGISNKFSLAALALVAGVMGATIARADSLAIDFENPPYIPGSIDGQNGWAGTLGGPINPLIDQEVVPNTYGYTSFDLQSWRISNAYTNGSFGDWPFSPSLANEAGETMAQNGPYSGGTRQKHFEVQWDFASTVPNSEQVGLQISTAPDRGDGARMSYIRMRDTSTGLSVDFIDYQDNAPYGSYGSPLSAAAGCGSEDDFVVTTVASGLSRTRPHTIRLTMDFVDGPRNDVVKVYVDGTLRHTGGSWEDYFRWCTESGGGTGTTAADQSRTVDSMIFQARGSCPGNCHPEHDGNGFLIDNLTYLSSTPTPGAKVSGGGTIEDPVFSPTGDLLTLPAITASLGGGSAQASFGFAINQGTTPKGNLEYRDHGSGDVIKATSYATLVISTGACGPNTHAKFTGLATVNGAPGQSLTVEVDDCGEGEPGSADTFRITAGSYSNGPKTLIGGNIQIH